MKTMMRTAPAAVAMAVLLAACGGSPTEAARVGAEGPSYDGGYGMGSGNREEPADSAPETTTTAADSAGLEVTGPAPES